VKNQRTSRQPILAGLTAATLLVSTLAGGCAPDPLPIPAAAPEAVSPALNQEQTLGILDNVSGTLTAATDTRDPDLLGERVTGPALAVRTSQLQVAAIRDDNDQVTVIPNSYQQLIVPTTETWPRDLFVITTGTETLQPPRLLVLEQANPRAPYQLWAWVQLLPGVLMPAFADPRVGSEAVAPDDTEAGLSPAEAVRQYADLLQNGQNSEFTGNFEPEADDALRSWLTGWRSAQETALQGERIEGTYYFSATPSESGVKAVRSADGGVMVMAELTVNERLEAMEGAVLAPRTPTALALLEGQEFTNVLTATYIYLIALYIPPAGSNEGITLLGYSNPQVGASVTYDAGEPASEDGEPATE
jgi:hypothetical protein